MSLITREPFACDVILEVVEYPTFIPPDLQEMVGVSFPVALVVAFGGEWITGRATEFDNMILMHNKHTAVISSYIVKVIDTYKI